eukprot:gene16083-22225_t
MANTGGGHAPNSHVGPGGPGSSEVAPEFEEQRVLLFKSKVAIQQLQAKLAEAKQSEQRVREKSLKVEEDITDLVQKAEQEVICLEDELAKKEFEMVEEDLTDLVQKAEQELIRLEDELAQKEREIVLLKRKGHRLEEEVGRKEDEISDISNEVQQLASLSDAQLVQSDAEAAGMLLKLRERDGKIRALEVTTLAVEQEEAVQKSTAMATKNLALVEEKMTLSTLLEAARNDLSREEMRHEAWREQEELRKREREREIEKSVQERMQMEWLRKEQELAQQHENHFKEG